MEPVASVVDKLKGFAKSTQDFADGLFHCRDNSNRRSPIEILKRLQREAFSDLMKLRDRQDKVERVLSFYKSSKGSPFQESSTHVRGEVDVLGALLMMDNVDQESCDAISRAGMKTGVHSRFTFETTIRQKDTLVTEFVVNGTGQDDVLGSPLSLAKVFYAANISDWFSVVAIPVGAHCRDVAVATNSPYEKERDWTVHVKSFLVCFEEIEKSKMGSTWEHVAEAANVVQLTGLNAVALIGMIVKAASTARMQKRNCKQFAQHLKLIGNLLEQLKIPEMNKYPEMREPLEQLEDALRRAYVLVNSCQEQSYLYLIAMGWNMVYQFRRAQEEIDRYLQIIPLITLLDNARVRERVEYIQKDQREYTFEDDDRRVQVAILSREPSRNDAMVLKKNLSCSYPDLPFDEALKKEKEKLKVELQQSQANMDVGQCEVIQRLIEVTENVASSPSVKTSSLRSSQTAKPKCSETNIEKGYSSNEHDFKKTDSRATSRITSVSSGHDLLSTRGSHQHEEWHSDLLGCCSEPYLCFKTFFYPCGTFSKVASVATGKRMSSTDACNELMAYSLILSCCCYTCCIRRKLRKMLNITGGLFDDFLSHLLCCCCALVQEWREVEIHEASGSEKTKTSPPPSQCMES